MEYLPSQPVYFGDQYTCSDDDIPAQLVDNNDKTMFQLSCEPCSLAEELMPDPNFDDPESFVMNDGWTISDNMLCNSGESGLGTSSIYQFDEDGYYQINITVDSLSAGASFRVSLGFTILGYITSTGTYTFYGTPASFFGNTGIIINPEVAGGSICISEITGYEIATNVIIGIYDEQDQYQAHISYTDNPEYFTLSKNTMTVTIDWATLDIVNGCYYLCIMDPCENTNGQNYPPVVLNQELSIFVGDGSTPNWTLGDDWTNTPPMTGFYAIGGSLSQDDVFPGYGNYCISIDFQNLLGSFSVYYGTNLVGTVSAGATSPALISGIPSDNLGLSFVMGPGGYVELIEVKPCDITGPDLVCNSRSNMFKVGDYEGKCTLLIHACNNEDGLGFVFDGSGFVPRVRLEAKLRQAKYESERNVYTDSVGRRSTYFFSGRKQKNLCIDMQPEYIHDFLRLLLGFDNVYISNVPYAVDDDEYNVEYSEVNDNVGKVRLLVSERTQNFKNTNCTGVENVCTLDDSYMLRADDPTSFVTQTNGGLIKIK